jgi:hypothetical protein
VHAEQDEAILVDHDLDLTPRRGHLQGPRPVRKRPGNGPCCVVTLSLACVSSTWSPEEEDSGGQF